MGTSIEQSTVYKFNYHTNTFINTNNNLPQTFWVIPQSIQVINNIAFLASEYNLYIYNLLDLTSYIETIPVLINFGGWETLCSNGIDTLYHLKKNDFISINITNLNNIIYYSQISPNIYHHGSSCGWYDNLL